jgi:hypothetical protein
MNSRFSIASGLARRLSTAIVVSACTLATSSAAAQLNDNFDGYVAGAGLGGQGGWSIWYSGGTDGTVSDAFASSGTNSLQLVPGSDMVFEFSGIDDGQWVYRAMTYMPSTSAGDAYIILMNGYGSASVDSWTTQVRFGGTDLLVESDFGGEIADLITDRWVEFRAEIDLDETFGFPDSVGLMDLYYDGVLFAEDLIWIDNAGTGGPTSIACTDLYNLDCDEFYVDDVSLLSSGPCLSDYSGDTVVDILDFLDFIDDFSACENVPAPCGSFGNSDVNGDTFVDILDFLDFIDAFANEC